MRIYIRYKSATELNYWDITTDEYVQDGRTREYKLPDGGKIIIEVRDRT